MPERSDTERDLAGESRDASAEEVPESEEPCGLRRALCPEIHWWRRRNRHLVDLRQTATRSGEILVAKGGIEPPTQGFSILCSTN